MRKVLIPLIACFVMCGCAKSEYTDNLFAMDTVMDLKIYAENDDALREAREQIERIDALLDRGSAQSEIYRINTEKTAAVSYETAAIIQTAARISERTGGAFDITTAPLSDLWGFYDGNFHVPSEEELRAAVDCVGYENIHVDKNIVSIPENVAIDLGGIGKGYAADKVIETLRERGVESAVISLGGNVHALGARPDGKAWKIGITNPADKSRIIGKLNVMDKAVVTSGGYQRCFEENNVTYHHIIDPKTGKSADTNLASVTVIADSGTLADAMSTALFVMGMDKALEMWRKSDDFEAVFVDKNGRVYVTETAAKMYESDIDYEICKR